VERWLHACLTGSHDSHGVCSLRELRTSQIFRKEHFFRGSDNVDQLLKILKVLGTEEFDKYMEKYDIEMETDSDALLRAWVPNVFSPECRLNLSIRWPRQPWTRYTTPDTLPFFTPEAVDLLEKLLRYDHQERLTAREAQAHAYFSEAFLWSMFFLSILRSGSRCCTFRGDRQSWRLRQRFGVLLDVKRKCPFLYRCMLCSVSFRIFSATGTIRQSP
jgi:serine/threonine protein kinase